MDYVMVPVPEEHVVDVMQHVARLVARASVVPWDDAGVEELFDEVDEASRSLLSLVARATTSGKELSDEDAAAQLELNLREIRSIVRDIHEVSQRNKREPILALREASVMLRNGRTVQRRLFAMTDTVARAVRAHERASLEQPPAAPTDTTE
jgi:transcription initiation factor IIE alpha subunit